MHKSQNISVALKKFIKLIQSDAEIELYNEAGLQHEMALFLRNEIGGEFKIQLERSIGDIFVDSIKHAKKEMDIYLVEKDNHNNKYCIELKLPHYGATISKPMLDAFKDVLFLEALIQERGFKKCFLFFASPKNAFWELKNTKNDLRKNFTGKKVTFSALNNCNVPSHYRNKTDECISPIQGTYSAYWKDFRKQSNPKTQKEENWRYFLLEL